SRSPASAAAASTTSPPRGASSSARSAARGPTSSAPSASSRESSMPDASHDARPDWSAAIDKHLAGAKRSPSDEAAIAEELRQHLDDHYEERRRRGADDADALRSALAELGD